MIPRTAAPTLAALAQSHPVVAITGARQAGKTTLAKATFPDKAYVSLEDPETWAFAHEDPRGFLARYPKGAIIDEAQRGLGLISPIRDIAERQNKMGHFILVGAQHLELALAINQSMGGQAGRLRLLPLSNSEHTLAGMSNTSLDEVLWRGGYPPLMAGGTTPEKWFPAYINQFLERDVFQFISMRNLAQFHRFIKLCAARTGQLLNLSAVAMDCGISHVTAGSWLSILEENYLVVRLPPYPRGFGKRVVKTPKLYFLDTGLAAWLMGIRDTDMLSIHPQRGMLFETWVVAEFIKARFNCGQPSNLYFWRDNIGSEIDLLYEHGGQLQPIEIKSGATIVPEWIDNANKWRQLVGDNVLAPWVIHGGIESYSTEKNEIVSWHHITGSLNSTA